MEPVPADSFNWLEHADKIVILLGALGAGIVWVWTQFKAYQRDKNQQAVDLHERETSYIAKVEARNEQLLVENANLQKQVLQARLDQVAAGNPPAEVLKTIIEACPKLMWAKRRIEEGKYVYVAVSYSFASLYFGGPPKAYVGKDPADYLPADIQENMLKLDEICIKTQAPVTLHQRVYGLPTNAEGTIDGYKFCIRLSDGYDYIVGIADHLTGVPEED